MRSDLRITFPQEVDNLAHSLCAAARAAAAVPGAVCRGSAARPCPRGRLGAPGAVPVLRGRRAADRLSCRPGTLAPSRALLRRIYALPQAGAAPVVLGLTGGYPVGAAVCASLLREGRLSASDARREALFCSCASPGFCIALAGVTLFGSGENRRAALRHTGRLRPVDRYFCFPWNEERTNDTGISRTFRQQTVLRRILLGRASCGGDLARRHGLSRDLLGRAHAHGAGLVPRSGAAAAVRPARADERSGCAFRVISPQKHAFRTRFVPARLRGASVLMQMQAVAAANGLALPGLVRAKLLHGALAAALSAALCRAFPSCVPAFVSARPVSSPSAVSAGVLAAVTVLYIFYSGKKRGRYAIIRLLVFKELTLA